MTSPSSPIYCPDGWGGGRPRGGALRSSHRRSSAPEALRPRAPLLRPRRPALAAAALVLALTSRACAAVARGLDLTHVQYSNLGGKGPNISSPEGIRYTNVTHEPGQRVDLLVTLRGGRPYVPSDPGRNGRVAGFGRVNVQTGTAADLLFKFVAEDSNKSVKIEDFYFTVYDMDQLVDRPLDGPREEVTVTGFISYCLSNDTDVSYKRDGSSMILASSVAGIGADDPQNPHELTKQQERRTASFIFKAVSSFQVHFEVTGLPNKFSSRDFLFAGAPINCSYRRQRGPVAPKSVAPYDCEAGLSTWSPRKKDWCCTHKGVNCPLTAAAGYDCKAGHSHWQREWPLRKKVWCCAHEGRGCPEKSPAPVSSTSEPYKCTDAEDQIASWRPSQRVWCCAQHNLGCPGKVSSLPYDCHMGLSHWRTAWASEKKTWCCFHQRLGCPTITAHYDCTEGTVRQWELPKQVWCCDRAPVRMSGCPSTTTMTTTQPYDCTSPRTKTWPKPKKAYCCHKYLIGCPEKQELRFGTSKAVRTCRGTERQWVVCDDLPECHTCTPINCAFEAWSEWSLLGGCTGLCMRQRSVAREHNDCGRPCEGKLVETINLPRCLPDACVPRKADCEWGDWNDWSSCLGFGLQQSYRSRKVVRLPANGGEPCAGSSNETRPCAEPPRTIDCAFMDWGEWTSCSTTCGGGWQAQMRRVRQHSEHGGRPCTGVMRRVAPCNTHACSEELPCKMAAWGQWAGCDAGSPIQRQRGRSVVRPPQGAGAPCDFALEEMVPCPADPAREPRQCFLTEWSVWSQCSATCQGQSFRGRSVHQHHPRCLVQSSALTRETRPCGLQSCHRGKDCRMSAWSDWEACSESCGVGMARRSRRVTRPGQASGRPCEGALKESKACMVTECLPVDCAWGAWGDWTACPRSCGGGMRHRSRMVEEAPRNGGAPCKPRAKSEVQACNTKSCEVCIDGAWGAWGDWSQCGATCTPALKVRHREVARRPNSCGLPASGLEDEYALCTGTPPCVAAVDCALSAWGEWSPCSGTCFGTHERTRRLARHAEGNGKPCSGQALKMVAPCHPGPGEQAPALCTADVRIPCRMSKWQDWEPCSSSCDGGQRQRHRHIRSPSHNGGPPCEGALAEAAPCGTAPCSARVCRDCQWGKWSAWSTCTKCGGQRYRHRSVARMPNECGRPCEPGHAKEASACRSSCGQRGFCAWTTWAGLSDCNAECGYGTKMEQRDLTFVTADPGADLFFEGAYDLPCSGTQIKVSLCPFVSCGPKCKPVDCHFAPWGDWGYANCTTHFCERRRSAGGPSTCGGRACKGPTAETKRCGETCDSPRDCLLGDWSGWEPVECKRPEDQRYRERHVLHDQAQGGAPCSGPLRETAPCAEPPPGNPADAVAGSWQEWGQCSRSCSGGWQTRTRAIAHAATNGGKPFSGPLAEATACRTQPCKDEGQPCVFGPWDDWSGCSDKGVNLRRRSIIQEPGAKGKRCQGPLREARSCDLSVDCRLSAWTGWDGCDRTCGGGQQQRQREVERGWRCPTALVELRGCNTQPCDKVDCNVSSWSAWSDCSVRCGRGQKARARSILELQRDGGFGCTGQLSQIEPCQGRGEDCSVCKDCRWSSWGDWGRCSRSCDRGQRSRQRDVVSMPVPGCRPCEPRDKAQVESCNTQRCDQAEEVCNDGKWGAWGDWEACSSTCRGGVTFRTRKVKVEANSCGKPALGPALEHAGCKDDTPCSGDRDCAFGPWASWTTCTSACAGVERRYRTIRRSGLGRGSFCQGALVQTRPCHRPGAVCPGGPAVDCRLGDWQRWGLCEVPCGIGQMRRSRDILQEAANGGQGCAEDITQTAPCELAPCHPAQRCEPRSCAWGDWGEWDWCDKCGGQTRRYRHILVHAQCGGRACEPGSAAEIAKCPRTCGRTLTYCAWGDWGPFGQCTATCGSAVRSRNRSLESRELSPSQHAQLGTPRDEAELQVKFARLKGRTRGIQAQRVRELVAAWLAGTLSLAAVLSAASVISARSRGDRASYRPLLQVSSPGRSHAPALPRRADGYAPLLQEPEDLAEHEPGAWVEPELVAADGQESSWQSRRELRLPKAAVPAFVLPAAGNRHCRPRPFLEVDPADAQPDRPTCVASASPDAGAASQGQVSVCTPLELEPQTAAALPSLPVPALPPPPQPPPPAPRWSPRPSVEPAAADALDRATTGVRRARHGGGCQHGAPPVPLLPPPPPPPPAWGLGSS